MQSSSVLYTVLGSVLALMTSLFIEWYKTWLRNKDNQKSIQIILKLELKGVGETLTRMIDAYGQKQFFHFTALEELNTKSLRLDKAREKVVHIKDDEKKEKILSLLNTISLYSSDLRALETGAFNPQSQGTNTMTWNDEYYKSQRVILAFRGTDLKRQTEDIIDDIERI